MANHGKPYQNGWFGLIWAYHYFRKHPDNFHMEHTFWPIPKRTIPNARSMYGELITPRFLPTFTNPINYLSRRYIDSLGILLKIFVPSPPSPNIFKNHPKSAVVSLAVCPERSCEIAKWDHPRRFLLTWSLKHSPRSSGSSRLKIRSLNICQQSKHQTGDNSAVIFHLPIVKGYIQGSPCLIPLKRK